MCRIHYVLGEVYSNVFLGIPENKKSGGIMFLFMNWGGNRKVICFSGKWALIGQPARPGFKPWFYCLLVERPSTSDLNLLNLKLFMNKMKKLIMRCTVLNSSPTTLQSMISYIPSKWSPPKLALLAGPISVNGIACGCEAYMGAKSLLYNHKDSFKRF